MAEGRNEPFIRHDGDFDDGNRQVSDKPSQFVGLKLTKNRSVDLVSRCPVFLRPYGLDKDQCALYSTRYGDFPGEVYLPLGAVPTFEWHRRV
eukprot:IDg11096t1